MKHVFKKSVQSTITIQHKLYIGSKRQVPLKNRQTDLVFFLLTFVKKYFNQYFIKYLHHHSFLSPYVWRQRWLLVASQTPADSGWARRPENSPSLLTWSLMAPSTANIDIRKTFIIEVIIHNYYSFMKTHLIHLHFSKCFFITQYQDLGPDWFFGFRWNRYWVHTLVSGNDNYPLLVKRR